MGTQVKCGLLMMQLQLAHVNGFVHAWWDDLVACGPSFGYYPKAASKTFLVVKEDYAKEAERAFADTSVIITTQWQRALRCGCWLLGFQGRVCVLKGEELHGARR